MKKRMVGTAVVACMAVVGLPSVAAACLSSNGPGSCSTPPGAEVSQIAQGKPSASSVAGPNAATDWDTAPGAPNTPGQAVKNLCIGGQ